MFAIKIKSTISKKIEYILFEKKDFAESSLNILKNIEAHGDVFDEFDALDIIEDAFIKTENLSKYKDIFILNEKEIILELE